MSLFCLPQKDVKKLKESALKGEIKIAELYKMTSEGRREFFAKYTDEKLGRLLNVEFEKAMISKQQTALTDWAKSVFKPEAQQEKVFKTVLDKIKSLDEMGVLTPKSEQAFLEDLVSDRLGISVSPEEVAEIKAKAEVIDAAQQKLGNDLGNPNKPKENLDFFKAKKEMDEYLQSLTPTSNVRVLTGTIGRGMMLASVKSPLLNIGSNIEIGFTEALSRRIATGALKGSDNALAVSYVKMVNKIYQETGYDLSRMMNLSDTGTSGARVLGKDTVHAGGPGKLRAFGRGVEDIVFKQLMGAPDVAFSSTHFADSVNLNSLKIAKGDVVKGKAIMEDAMKIKPETPDGELARQQGILDAQVATWTDKTWASQVAEGIRGILNKVSGDLRAGDYLLPFVKTPANVIATSMDYAGMGIPKALIKTIKGIRAGTIGEKETVQSIMRDLVRAGIGLTAAFIIASQLSDDDFVGAYDPARAQIEALRNSNTNSIRIGGKWISMDWFGPLSVPITAIMYSRKYGGTGVGNEVFQYGQGTASAILKVPGISDVADYFKKRAYAKKTQTLTEAAGGTFDFITSEIYSRLIPSLFSDVAKATDPYERKTSGKIDTIKAKIPGARQTLPIKTNVFGEEMKGESAVSDILFGARVKTDKENPIITEIRDVSLNNDKAITFTDWDNTSNKSLAQFKQKVGDEAYNQAKVDYGQELQKNLESLFAKHSYLAMDDADKLKAINNTDSDALKKVLAKHGFTYKKINPTSAKAPSFTSGDKVSEQSFVQKIATYAQAIGTDPVTAFEDIIHGQIIRRTDNGTVIVYRMSLADSTKVKEAGGGNNPTMKLDHTLPLQLGGSNVASNLKLVSTEEWASYTPVENYLGDALRSNKIEKKDAQRLMLAFKNKEINFEEVKAEVDK